MSLRSYLPDTPEGDAVYELFLSHLMGHSHEHHSFCKHNIEGQYDDVSPIEVLKRRRAALEVEE